MSVLELYANEKERYVDNCTRCGLCAKRCPILPLTDINTVPSHEIQQGVFEFIRDGVPNDYAYTKAFACMECFKCTADLCPEGLDPLVVNEFIKQDYVARGLVAKSSSDAGRPDSTHRVLARLQVNKSEYQAILTRSKTEKARYVFFPGCNVYYQPEKILNALDIIAAIGDDFAFLPGLDFCCGDRHLFTGWIEAGARLAKDLAGAIEAYQPEAVVLWCPTCHCRFEQSIVRAFDIPFKILSFPQYLAANMHKLSFGDDASGTVTLHEACKSTYTGVDGTGPRDVLRQLPGVRLLEMAHTGERAVCCGSGAIAWFPQSCAGIRGKRLREAEQTGAETLVTVCHYCHQTFTQEEQNYPFQVANYVNLVAAAMGIRRTDKFAQFTRWGNTEKIIGEAAKDMACVPFAHDRIVEVVQAVFG